jgi:predicted nucleic acid-binding protein
VKVVPDTNVWIRWLRARSLPAPPADAARLRVLVASPVLQELWAGVRSDAEARDLERLHELARRSRTLLNPPAAAWVISGQALRTLAERGTVGPRRLRALRNDALLAASAALVQATVITENVHDFELLARVIPVRHQQP